jgi:hypothetical protein
MPIHNRLLGSGCYREGDGGATEIDQAVDGNARRTTVSPG